MPNTLATDWIKPEWPAPPQVHAWSTTRTGGVSRAPYDSFNLGDHVGDDPDAVRQNRARLVEYLQLPAEPLWLNQVHGCQVVDPLRTTSRPEADASVSRQPNRVCAVLTADCLPVLFCDRAGTRVAAAHAGWRGLAAGVLEATVAALEVDPAEIMAWLGPAIGPDAFEVGGEVREAFVNSNAACATAFTVSSGDHWLADLYALARLQLAYCGVDAVYGGGFCTYTNAEQFFSYRRDGVTGRMASLVWLNADG
jgi:YfiH family protein